MPVQDDSWGLAVKFGGDPPPCYLQFTLSSDASLGGVILVYQKTSLGGHFRGGMLD